MLLTITRIGTTGPIVIGGAVGVLAAGVSSRDYDLGIDRIEQLGPTLTRLADAGLITWSTSASPNTPDGVEGTTVSDVDAKIAAAIAAALAGIRAPWFSTAAFVGLASGTVTRYFPNFAPAGATGQGLPASGRTLVGIVGALSVSSPATLLTATRIEVVKNTVGTGVFVDMPAGSYVPVEIACNIAFGPTDIVDFKMTNTNGGATTCVFCLQAIFLGS